MQRCEHVHDGRGRKRKIVTLDWAKPKHYLTAQGVRKRPTVIKATSTAESFIPLRRWRRRSCSVRVVTSALERILAPLATATLTTYQ